MGAGDDLHLVDGGGYPNAEASEVATEALVSLEQPPIGAPPLPDADDGLQGDDSGFWSDVDDDPTSSAANIDTIVKQAPDVVNEINPNIAPSF